MPEPKPTFHNAGVNSWLMGTEPSQVRIRVLIVDDQLHYRRGLRSVLEGPGTPIEIVGEAADGQEAIDQAGRLRPDVILLDVHMPVLDGITAARALTQHSPNSRILMLTVSDLPEDVASAAKAGAAGYMLKDRSLAEVADAVVSLATGHSWPLAAG